MTKSAVAGSALLAIAVISVLFAIVAARPSKILPSKPTASVRVAARLRNVAGGELMSINPEYRKDEDGTFYGHRVLGKVRLDAAGARGLADAIAAAVSDQTAMDAQKACAFVPRHAVRFVDVDGTTTDFVMCFTCGDASMTGVGLGDGFSIDAGPRGMMDALFRRDGIPVAE